MDESTKTIEICQLLKKELLDNGYKYGFYLRDRCVTPNISLGFDEEFANLLTSEYRIQEPIVSRREKVATCLDAVLIMKEILFEQAIESKIWMLFLKEKRKAHSVLTFEIDGRIVYLELTPQSGKSNYGKEILFEGMDQFVSYWEQQGYIVSDITDVCTPGANPDFFMDLLK